MTPLDRIGAHPIFKACASPQTQADTERLTEEPQAEVQPPAEFFETEAADPAPEPAPVIHTAIPDPDFNKTKIIFLGHTK